jgi:hypothetical protein
MEVRKYFRTSVLPSVYNTRIVYVYRRMVYIQSHVPLLITKVRKYFRTFEGTKVLSKVLPEVRTKVHVGHNSNLWG